MLLNSLLLLDNFIVVRGVYIVVYKLVVLLNCILLMLLNVE